MIHIEDTQIKIGNSFLPGLFKSINVTCDAQVEEQDVPGSPIKKKQAMGYEDAKITIELSIEDGVFETKEQKLQELQNYFRKVGQGKPVIHNIISAHLAIRGITKVIIKSFESKETNSKKEIVATLTLWEYASMTVTATKSPAPISASSTSGTAKAPSGKVATRQTNSTATKAPGKGTQGGQRPEKAYQRGTAPKLSKEKKEAKSPAKDTAKINNRVKAVRKAALGKD